MGVIGTIRDFDPCKEISNTFFSVYKNAAVDINDFVKSFINTLNNSFENVQNAINSLTNVSIEGANEIIRSIIDFVKEIDNLNIYLYKLLSELSFTIELFSLHPILYGLTMIMSIFFPNVQTHRLIGFVIVGTLVLIIGFICTILSILFFVSGLIKF